MKKRVRILVLSFLTIILISLAGCSGSSAAEIDNQDGDGKSKMSNNDVICGGTTNNTDYNAPKEISSDNLVSFSVGFYHENKYDRSNGRYYTFVVEPDENVELYFSDTYVSEGFSVEQSVLQDIQAIIKKYDLVKANGVHKVTAGLPPEYEECYFKAEYDSGEYLSFSENSDPSAKWSEELLEYFANLMAEHGDDRYIIPSITGVIERFHLEVKDGDIMSGASVAPETIEQFNPMLTRLMEYMDTYLG